MDALLYPVGRALIALLQALPLNFVARLGRVGGMLAWWLDARHRRVALNNLTLCFGQEKSPAEIRALAREHFRRLGENYASAIKTATMSFEELRPHVEVVGDPAIVSPPPGTRRRAVSAVGHFGNFELYARVGQFSPTFQCATTYRNLRQRSANRLLLELRHRSGCLYFERNTDRDALKEAMKRPDILLGLLADQHAGRKGLRLPFLGHECSTTASPAVFALRYDCPLHPGICYRVALARWRIEFAPAIPTREHARPRTVEAIMLDVNRAFEEAVRRDPANWFWVHNRWRPQKAPVTTPDPPNPPRIHSADTLSPSEGERDGVRGSARMEDHE